MPDGTQHLAPASPPEPDPASAPPLLSALRPPQVGGLAARSDSHDMARHPAPPPQAPQG
jgi:hypothetical protein